MAVARSKITAQGQISVPAMVRRKLGVGPGSVLEWHEDGERVVVCRAEQYSSADIHRALFSKRPPAARTTEEMKAGTRRYLKGRHARD
jgi:antitoxin PrlF